MSRVDWRTRRRLIGAALTMVVLLGANAAMADSGAGLVAIPPHFAEQGAEAGVTAVYAGDFQYIVGGGAASFDCAHDGRPSLFVAGGEGRARFFRNLGSPGGPLRFEQQDSGLEFTAVTGAYPIDIDGDGEVDLVVLRVGSIELMRGSGDCHFQRANEAWGFESADGWWTSFSATWERGSVWPTLAFGAYFDRHEEIEPWGTCTPNLLYRPKLAGGLPQRGFAAPQPLTPSWCALSMLFTDWNRSGTPSLRVSNDREYYRGGQEQLWHLDPGQPPRPYTEAEGWKYLRIWGMGIASRDLSGSGYPDYFLTSMADQKLQRLDRPAAGSAVRPAYTDIAYPKGVTAHRPYAGGDPHPSTGWHAQFEDVNNDGLADLFIAKGNVSAMPDFATRDPNNLLMQKPDGSFTEMGDVAGVASYAQARGAVLADFNLDGGIDLLVVNRNSPATLYRNDTPGRGHWVQFRLEQPGPNHDGIGAWVEVRSGGTVNRRELTVGGGHAGGSLGWMHFGLGAAERAEVRVRWPGGADGDWQPVAVDHFWILAPGTLPRPWSPT